MKSLPTRQDGIHYRNVAGPQIRKLRYARNWTQEQLAVKMQCLGYDITRGKISKIEARLVWVPDFELFCFALVFNVMMRDLFPPPSKGSLSETMDDWTHRR